MIQDKARIIKELEKIVGPNGVVHEEDELRVYETDGLTIFKAMPDVVVLASTAEEVTQLIKLCEREKIPYVPRGAGTGLSGGALPLDGGVMIGMNRMNRILEVDYDNKRAVVEPGMVNVWLTNAVGPRGYYYAPDPASQIACSIGGNVSENSGGVRTPKYGVTTNHIMGVEVVLPNGNLVKLGGKTLDAPGYDLLGVFVGSEGTFGIVTKVIVRLMRKPEAVKTLMAVFENLEDASNTVSGVVAAGIIPVSIEMMDNNSIVAVEKGVGAGYPTDAGSVLVIEVDGPRAEVEALVDPIRDVCKKNNVREVRLAKDDDERALLWKGRKAAFAAMGQISPDYYVQDAVIPRTRLPQILQQISEFSEQYGLRVANVFHAGDGNLHPLILYDSRNEGELEKAEEMGSKIMKACISMGGSITGEHGVGREKREYMPLMYTDDDMEAMKKVKRVFNPDGVLNPGKIFPTTTPDFKAGPTGQRGIVEKVTGQM